MALSLAVGLSLHALAMMPSHLPTLPSSRPSSGLVGADGRSARAACRAACEERDDGEHVAHPYTASQSRVDHLTRVHLVHYDDNGGNDAHMLGEPTGASQDRDAKIEHGPVKARAVLSGHARRLGKAVHRTRPVVMLTEDERTQAEHIKQLVAEHIKQVEQIKAAGRTQPVVRLTEDERKQVVEQIQRITQGVEQIKQEVNEREQVTDPNKYLFELSDKYVRLLGLLAVYYLLHGALSLGCLLYRDANLEAEAFSASGWYMIIAPSLFDVFAPDDASTMVKYNWKPPIALWMGSMILLALSAADKIAALP